MYIIKLSATTSTNSYLKEMASTRLPKDYTVVVADHQTNGRGQMGTSWDAENGKNLTISVFKSINNFKIELQYYISMLTAIAIYEALLTFRVPKLSIKWPNDILSENKKICGILIENVIKNNTLQGTIVGIGLNINQKNFEDLPKASSMSLITGVLYDKDEVLSELLKKIKCYFNTLEQDTFNTVKLRYESLLFRLDKPSTFRLSDDNTFSGIIKGVSDNGKLRVWTEDDIIKTFNLKDIELLY